MESFLSTEAEDFQYWLQQIKMEVLPPQKHFSHLQLGRTWQNTDYILDLN